MIKKLFAVAMLIMSMTATAFCQERGTAFQSIYDFKISAMEYLKYRQFNASGSEKQVIESLLCSYQQTGLIALEATASGQVTFLTAAQSSFATFPDSTQSKYTVEDNELCESILLYFDKANLKVFNRKYLDFSTQAGKVVFQDNLFHYYEIILKNQTGETHREVRTEIAVESALNYPEI
ncbi:MAG: hypothetical protein PHW04_18670 [Candidatus Wallbacteria bacterium]|nr:hypothetical protein [Candidatus Wallbacteria bacterium]